MSSAAIEVCDAGLVVVDESDLATPAMTPSPGYALLDGEVLLTGAAAESRARLKPRRVCRNFWSQLDQALVGRPFDAQLTHADLVHAHLGQIWELVGSGVDEVLLAVPGTYSDQQLGMLLGIARALELPIRGLSDAATAAAVHVDAVADLIHVELHLHGAVVSELVRNEEIERRRIEVEEQAGWLGVQDVLARHVSDTFLRRTRFEPLHAAATEQRLYDSLSYWLDRFRTEDAVELRIDSGDNEYGIELQREELVDVSVGASERLARRVSLLKRTGKPTAILLSQRAARLPGLAARLAEIEHTEVLALPETAAAAGVLVAREHIRGSGDALPFVTRLPAIPGAIPWTQPAVRVPEGKPSDTARGPRVPTHVLSGAVAYEIREDSLFVGVATPDGSRGIRLAGLPEGVSRSHCSLYRGGGRAWVEDHSSHGTFLNGERVHESTALAVGDRLGLGGGAVELQLIEVMQANGATQS